MPEYKDMARPAPLNPAPGSPAESTGGDAPHAAVPSVTLHAPGACVLQPPAVDRTCRNCETLLAGRYCHSCGQDEGRVHLRLRDLMSESIRDATNLDTPVLRTVVGLVRRPGLMCRDYLRGHRVRYVNPVRFYLMTGALAVVSLQIAIRATPATQATSQDEAVRAVVGVLINWSHLFTLFSYPPGALLLVLLFRSSQRPLIDHIVFMLFTAGLVFVVMTLGAPFYATLPFTTSVVGSLFYFVYFAWACLQFYGGSVVATVAKSVIVLFLCTVVYLIISIFAAIIVAVWIVHRSEGASGEIATLMRTLSETSLLFAVAGPG